MSGGTNSKKNNKYFNTTAEFNQLEKSRMKSLPWDCWEDWRTDLWTLHWLNETFWRQQQTAGSFHEKVILFFFFIILIWIWPWYRGCRFQLKKRKYRSGPYLWLCALVSRALRGGVGDPCSVTLRTSRLFLSGRQRPWRVSMGESTRFLGGSWRTKMLVKKHIKDIFFFFFKSPNIKFFWHLDILGEDLSLNWKWICSFHNKAFVLFFDRPSATRESLLTNVISGWQILIFTAGVSLLPVQQEVVNHLLLVLPAEKDAETLRDQRRRTVKLNWRTDRGWSGSSKFPGQLQLIILNVHT